MHKYLLISFVGLSLLLLSCGQVEKPVDKETTKEGHMSTTFSTDVDKLGRILDLKLYKPTKVKFEYIFINNSGEADRTVPGPSDSYLQAVLYFNDTTFRRMNKANLGYEDYGETESPNKPDLSKGEFDFEWLDKDIKEELQKSDTSFPYNYSYDKFFGTGKGGKIWYLDNKILLRKSSN